MKKLLCLIFAISMLSCMVFATSNVSFDKPDSQTFDKIEKAIEIDGYDLYLELYDVTKYQDYTITDNSALKNIGSYNGNYILIYGNEDMRFETTIYKAYGNHYFRFHGVPYAVYSAEQDKLISLEEAISSGLFPAEVIDEINNHHIEIKNETGAYFYFGSRLGDVNTDGKINILDVVKTRDLIVNRPSYTQVDMYSPATAMDINKDGKVNIVDVVNMRNIIVNG